MTKREEQLSKIEAMGITSRKKYIRGMKKLLEHYIRGEKSPWIDCPLCPIHIGCENCPWDIMMGKVCLQYKGESDVFSVASMYELRSIDSPCNFGAIEAWRKLRIKQLTKWIEVWESVE